MVRTLCIWFIMTTLGAIALLKLSLKIRPDKPDEFRPFDANYLPDFRALNKKRTQQPKRAEKRF
jgi:hypothetical protein